MVTGTVRLQDDGEIYCDDELVGYLGWNENVLVDISVDEERQGEGIGTRAVEQLVERLRSQGYDRITTTTVVSGAMEVVLSRNGFEQVVVEENISVSDEVLAELDEQPTKETTEWVKEL